ncbi:MAG: large subunit ribosomal protein [Patescibacteria group bacterium]|jgi:large subunit ribosomal protein L17|nr:large subunit ribosomal protein [Patescibacteria group bacterium]
MRHHNHNRKFGRKKKVRSALLKSLVLSLIVYGRIRTTEAKAKEIRPIVEKMVTRALSADVNAKRVIMSRLMNRAPETKKLIEEIAPKFKGVAGGYTRILKLPNRKSDGAKMALIEFVK